MNRSPFANFRKPHELLASAADPPSPSPSRSRNRSSGSPSRSQSSGTSRDGTDSETYNIADYYPRSSSRGSRSKSRSVSPPWESQNLSTMPLLPAREDSHSPYPLRQLGDEGVLGVDWRIGEGPEGQGFASWLRGGKLGRWITNTHAGRMVYAIFLIVLYGVVSLILLIMNRFILWTGVYKFGYPITTTLLQLLFTQFFLIASASITRSFSSPLHALGFGCMVAPRPKPSKGKRRAAGGLRDFASNIRASSSGGVFEFKWSEVRLVIPLAVVYSMKIILSNLSFAFTQLQIYQLSRVSSLIWTIVFTHLFHRTTSLSVTTLSSCITMVLSLTMVSLRPGTRFAIEGFVAGIFSTFFVAAYPVLLARTYKTFTAATATTPMSIDLGNDGPVLSGDGKDNTRASWKMLHYINTLSIVFIFPWAIISGELKDISRNCYFLDVAFFWLMVLGAGAAAWATFVTGFLVVMATTPLTMVVTTYPRSALQTVLLTGFKLATWSWVGVLMCWGSMVWYIAGRRKECGISFYSIDENEGRERGRERRSQDA